MKAERPLRDDEKDAGATSAKARSFVKAERPPVTTTETEVPRNEAEISLSVEPVFSTTLDRMGGEAMSVKAERPLKDAIEDGPVGYKVSPVVRERKSARFAIN